MIKAKKQSEGKFHQAIKGIMIHTVDEKGCGMLESSGCAQLQHQRVWGTCCIHRLVCCAASVSGASRMGSSDHTSHVWGWMWFSGLMIEDLCWWLIGCMFSTQLKQVLIYQSLLLTCTVLALQRNCTFSWVSLILCCVIYSLYWLKYV